MNNENIIFLGGHRKSGTTMLLNLIDGHPEVCVYPTDIAILYAYFPVWTADGVNISERLDRLDRVLFGTLSKIHNRHKLGELLPVEKIREHFWAELEREKAHEIVSVIGQIMKSYRLITNQSIEEKPFFAFKETSLEIYACELGDQFPNAKFIQLIRDPRDNMGALRAGVDRHYKNLGEDERHILASLIHRVGISLRLHDSNLLKLGQNRFKSLTFERLVSSPEVVARDIADFAGWQFSECMKKTTIMGVATRGNNYEGDPFMEITRQNVARWRDRITEFEAKVIEFHLGDLMERHGYELAFAHSEAAAAASEFYKWTNYKFFFNDSFGE